MKEKNIKKKRTQISKKRRNNAILYPLYKMFSWDLLSFYSIEFLFYTITKGITASQVLMLTAIYMLLKIILQIPAVMVSDYIGRRKSIIIGNGFVIIYILLLIAAPNIMWIIIARTFCAFGYDMKQLAEGNLLYDSVSTKGGDGIYTKIDSKGASGYYILDTVLALISGYLFVINNYIPMIICLILMVIATLLSIKFKDIYENNNEKIKFKKFFKKYSNDIKDSFKFIRKSKRMKSYIIFAAVFYGLIRMMSTYQSNLLTDINVTEEQFSMIYAVLNLIAAVSVTFSRKIQRTLKNKTLTFLSLSYIISMLFAGAIALSFKANLALPCILVFYTIIRISDSQWWITEYTYLKNFSTPESRNKITFTYELLTSVGASIIPVLGATLLNYISIKYAMLFVGLIFLAIMIIILDYMKTRFGLKPEHYKKEDIEFFTKQN